MKKVILNITVEMEFDDDYPLATSLEDCHTVGGRAASRAWYSLAELISDWYPRECYIINGEIRTGPMAGYDSRLEGEVSKVEVMAGDEGCLGYAEINRDDEHTGVIIAITEGVRS